MAFGKGVVLVLLLVLAIAAGVKLLELFKTSAFSEADASKFVLEDLRSKYPGADIAVMTILPKQNEVGGKYLEVKARVTEEPDTPCPARSHIFYNYPAQNFVPQLPEVITANCKVCTEGICNLAFPEEAIIASHTLAGTDLVGAYIRYNPDARPSVQELKDSWVVTWNSELATYHYIVNVHGDGRILNVTRVDRN